MEVWQSVEEMVLKPHRKGTTMSSEDYKALTLRLYAAIGEVFRTGDSGLLDPLLAPDMIDHTPASGPIMGREPGKQLIASFARAFPDTTLTVDLMVAETDCVAAFVSYRSTHSGSFMGHPPTGTVVRVTGMDIMRYRDGQVVELWSQFDDLGLLQQLGIVPRQAD
jgi:predicted ester cyclase